ncbi:hypothetical protein K4L06_17725 [Lysobacter sp. BMK333-48F3]|nr:hypothetical protein [Lysobacter sp. BMK333-48F3]
MQVYSYKITRDYGFAPNPFHGACTLATCKPKIRKAAKIGDLVFGCGSKANKRPGELICAMRVSKKITFQEYWDDPSYAVKRPNFHASPAHAYGDNIYHRNARKKWKQERSHHSYADGSVNQANLDRDTTTSEMVLISYEFVYFGRDSIPIPKKLRSFANDDLYPSTRDYRSQFSPNFIRAIERWFNQLPRGNLGRPINWS